jgi:hypothetical protein
MAATGAARVRGHTGVVMECSTGPGENTDSLRAKVHIAAGGHPDSEDAHGRRATSAPMHRCVRASQWTQRRSGPRSRTVWCLREYWSTSSHEH